jgi:hypothetical protein
MSGNLKRMEWWLAIAVLIGWVCASPLAAQEGDKPPERVLRFMMSDLGVCDTVPLEWDAEGSVAMIVMPQAAPEADAMAFATVWEGQLPPPYCYFDPAAADVIYGVILNTLNENLETKIDSGEITPEEILVIADLLFDAFNGGTWNVLNEVTHVATGGATRLTNVYFNAGPCCGLPPQGSMAQAGPDGDVLVLGEFGFRFLSSGESYGNKAGIPVVTDTDPHFRAQLAIGWFTR